MKEWAALSTNRYNNLLTFQDSIPQEYTSRFYRARVVGP